jgi:hypothetical protein
MSSPFALFRRNQKVLTVILTCLAMFAFIILGSVQDNTELIIPILFGLGSAAMAWLWGSKNERGVSYSTIGVGAVAGVLAGTFIISQHSNQGGVSTALGRLSNRDLMEMKQERDAANQFIVGAFRERKTNAYPFMMERYTFGGTSTREVVFKMLLDHEADQLGIAISDKYITKYLKEVSGHDEPYKTDEGDDRKNEFNREKLTALRSQIGLGESELYDLLRSELRVRVAYRVLNPQVVHMPDQYWGDFEKLNVTHSIDAVAIPVEPFAKRLLRPSDAELTEVFEDFKSVYPMAEHSGFRQPDRLKLAWFESNSDFEAAEKLVGEISEEDLKARYEERKEAEYKIQTLPDFGSGFDDGGLKFGNPPAPEKTTPPAGEDKSTDEAPKTDAATETGDAKVDPAAKPDATAKPDGDAPAKSPKGEDTPSKVDPTTPAPPDDKETSPEAGECGDGEDQESDSAPASDQKQEKSDAATDPTDPESKSDDETKPTGKTKPVGSEPKPADATKPAEKKTETPKPDDAATDKSATAAADESATEPADDSSEKPEDPATSPVPEIKYRSFEEVRDEIRDRILVERTEAFVAEQIAAALASVKEWRFNIREQNAKISNDDLAAAIAKKAEAFAAENDLQFVKVDEFLSYSELSEHAEHSIGKAREPFDISQITSRTEPQTVPTRLFTGATSLFIPEAAEGQFNDMRYVFWATGEQESHVPKTLDEPGVREKVEEAVRMQKARPEAEARAKKVAEELQAKFNEVSIVLMAEGIAGQTILGGAQPEAVEPKADDAGTADGAGTEPESEAGDEEESANEESCADEDEKGPTPQTASEEADPAKETDPAKKADPAKQTDPVKEETTPAAPKLVLDAPEPVGDEAKPVGDAPKLLLDEPEAVGDAPEVVGNAPQPIEEETTDEATADSLAVISSRPFTWYRQSSQGMQMNPFAEPTVEFGVINGIDGVDDNFMQAVSEAKVGEVVVIPNVTKEIYYVVYIKARNPSGNDDPSMGPVRQQFIMENVPMSRIYGRLARVPASDIQQKWQEAFLLKHDVDSAELDAI